MTIRSAPEIPACLSPALDFYLDQCSQHIPGALHAFYLTGSIALNSFDPRLSDIDFVAVIQTPILPALFSVLVRVHKNTAARFPRWPFDGSYLPEAALDPAASGAAPQLRFRDRRLIYAAAQSLSPLDWWLLKQHGIALLGPDRQSLPIAVDWTMIIPWMKNNLNTYWAAWLTRPIRFLHLLSDWGIHWMVLGVLRQLNSFKEHTVISKIQAGEYGLQHLPERWQPLIRTAIHLRQQGSHSPFSTRLSRAVYARQFLGDIIQTCNQIA